MYYGELIKSAVTVRDICDMYGIEINKAGFARCPFHAEKTASFKVFKDGCKCFGCGEYAQNAIDLTMKLFGLSFVQACEKINNDFGLNLSISHTPSLREAREAEQRIKDLKAKHEAEKAEHDRLKKNYDDALTEYVRLERQMTDNTPASADDMNDLYVEAVSRIAYAAYSLDLATMELYEYEHRRNQDN